MCKAWPGHLRLPPEEEGWPAWPGNSLRTMRYSRRTWPLLTCEQAPAQPPLQIRTLRLREAKTPRKVTLVRGRAGCGASSRGSGHLSSEPHSSHSRAPDLALAFPDSDLHESGSSWHPVFTLAAGQAGLVSISWALSLAQASGRSMKLSVSVPLKTSPVTGTESRARGTRQCMLRALAEV